MIILVESIKGSQTLDFSYKKLAGYQVTDVFYVKRFNISMK